MNINATGYGSPMDVVDFIENGGELPEGTKEESFVLPASTQPIGCMVPSLRKLYNEQKAKHEPKRRMNINNLALLEE